MVAPQPFYEDRGTPIALRQVLEALSELEYRVDLLTFPVGQDIELPGLTIYRTGNPFGISQVPIGFSAQKVLLDLSLTAKLASLLRRERYTCLHALEEAAFPAAVAGRHHGVPLLYDMQSSLPEQLLRQRALRLQVARRPLEAIERWLLTRADFVVSSAGLADRVVRMAPITPVREWRFPSRPVATDPAGALALRRELGLALDERVVLYSGTFEPYQGLPELITAIPLVLAEAPAARFVLVGGDGTNGFAGSEAVAPLLASRVLRIIDRQPRPAMAAYHALADVLVSPRAYGGNLPLKVFDYLAAGRPIVATDIPTHRTVLAEDRAVLVAPASGAIAEGILSLLRDPERAARIGRAARRYAREHLAWEAFVSSVEEIYEEVHRHARGR
ncbi:MAG: glycosyltransferase [Gemmatimonadales bacterium]|nr:glycosyltransferase [Gemmatimonadales bacterium]